MPNAGWPMPIPYARCSMPDAGIGHSTARHGNAGHGTHAVTLRMLHSGAGFLLGPKGGRGLGAGA